MGRISPEVEIKYICNVIDKNIEAHKILNDRGLLSENILSQLRNLTEDIAILINNKENHLTLDSHYDSVAPSMDYVSSKKKYNYIKKFHEFLKSTVSHYTPSENDAERLMLHYFRYICMFKDTLENECGITVLNKLGDFPIYEDAMTKEHYEKVCRKIDAVTWGENKYFKSGRFYINKCRPIYANGKLYYELTLTKATDYHNKFERILMYSKRYIPDNYSIKISYQEKEIELFSSISKIKVIDNYIISIRPCEIRNLGKLIGESVHIDDKHSEYIKLMQMLKDEEIDLLELITCEEIVWNEYINKIKETSVNNNLSNLLFSLRMRLAMDFKGNNILRYCLVKMDNKTIKDQHSENPNVRLDGLYVENTSIPFDSMPYAMSLHKHNISWFHLIKSISLNGREYEMFAKYIKDKAENENILYVDVKECEKFGNIEELIAKYNHALNKFGIDTYGRAAIKLENDFLCINSYEANSVEIINTLKSYKQQPAQDLKKCLDATWLTSSQENLSDDKMEILSRLLRGDSIAIIHGPAGTGKTKMLEVLASAFKDYKKIFLSNTKTSVENLRKRITAYDEQNSYFKTASSYVWRGERDECDEFTYDILIIDESGTINNADMVKILRKQRYKLIILAGDVFQIESIKYGNWFSFAYNLFKADFVYELINTNRTSETDLLELWKLVRDNNEQAINKISNNEYSRPISEEIFTSLDDDEIILCLNYDGLYGINNINKLLQENNPEQALTIGVDTYKINDPVVFNDCERFLSIYNNMKGTIKNIEIDSENEKTWFTILVDEVLDGRWNGFFEDYEVIEQQEEKTLIRFYVENFKDTNNDETSKNHIIPFNLAYAVSIHKAQGLEYNSVKIIITSCIEDEITKNIFYTAITRSKKYLRIFWSSETQKKIFENMEKKNKFRDIPILKQRFKI